MRRTVRRVASAAVALPGDSLVRPLRQSAEVVHIHSAAFDDVLERADGDGFTAVHRDDHLPAIRVTPFLMAAALDEKKETVPSQDADDVMGVTDGEMLAHGRATSSSLAPLCNSIGVGSNHNASASFALAMASVSLSPALPQPGNSGNTADHRFACRSYSITKRNFMRHTIANSHNKSKPTASK